MLGLSVFALGRGSSTAKDSKRKLAFFLVWKEEASWVRLRHWAMSPMALNPYTHRMRPGPNGAASDLWWLGSLSTPQKPRQQWDNRILFFFYIKSQQNFDIDPYPPLLSFEIKLFNCYRNSEELQCMFMGHLIRKALLFLCLSYYMTSVWMILSIQMMHKTLKLRHHYISMQQLTIPF